MSQRREGPGCRRTKASALLSAQAPEPAQRPPEAGEPTELFRVPWTLTLPQRSTYCSTVCTHAPRASAWLGEEGEDGGKRRETEPAARPPRKGAKRRPSQTSADSSTGARRPRLRLREVQRVTRTQFPHLANGDAASVSRTGSRAEMRMHRALGWR